MVSMQLRSKVSENEKYKKVRGVDLSLFWFSYDTLFTDIVATGERARAPNQRSAIGEQSVADEEGHEFVSTPPGDLKKEGSGDSDLELGPNHLFPQSYSASQKTGSSGSKRKKSGAELIRDSLEGVIWLVQVKAQLLPLEQIMISVKLLTF
ncbi:hypothetical protein ACET3Z_018039 [Daucus carota]